jgi:integrase
MNDLKIRAFVMHSGERYSLLVDRLTGVPVYAPNLYLTSQVRNASLSHAALSAYASHLLVLHRFCLIRHIDLKSRLMTRQFLVDAEIDSLRDFSSYRFNDWLLWMAQPPMFSLEELLESQPRVTKETQYVRLTVTADYLLWLGRQYFDHLQIEPPELKTMAEAIKAKRPSFKGRNQGLENRALSESEADLLLSVIEVEAPSNPFDQSVRSRNRLMVLMEYELGIRGGELLNIRIEDINFAQNILLIIRRADQADDPRLRQPLVKTLDRELVLSDWLVADIHRYVLGDRRAVPNARKTSYLFVTCKAGPTCGQALSISSYNKMWATLQQSSLLLRQVTGHRLRHSWNGRFSETMDKEIPPKSEAKQEAMRSQLMGWQPGSGTGARYNRRFIVEKARKASLDLQRSARKGHDGHEK